MRRPAAVVRCGLLAAGILLTIPAAAFVERPDDQLLLLELRLGRLTLHEAVVAYLDRDRLLLPLGEVARALDLAIEVDPGSGTANGWFLREDRLFSLDLRRGEVVVEGRRLPLPAGAAEAHRDDLYIDASVLSSWLPVDFEPDLRSSRVLLHTREPLPVEERLERQRRHDQLKDPDSDNPSASHTEELPLPYRAFDWPALEHRLAFTTGQRRDGSRRTVTQSNLLAAGDLLWNSAELAVTHLDDGSTGDTIDRVENSPDIRLRLGRLDAEGELLGPLRATAFAFGDLPTPGRALVSEEDFARGLELSNFPLDRPETFDRTTVRGDALPGWEAELYRNGELYAAAQVAEDGRYTFADVPLTVGLNLLRVVLYGPRGQLRERIERVLIGPDSIPVGQTHYRFALHQHGRRLLADSPTLDDELTNPRWPDHGAPRLFTEVEHGLRRGLGLGLRVQSLPVQGRQRTYLATGLTAAHRGFLAQLETVAELDGGQAARLFVEGHLDRLVLRATHRHFQNFTSELTADDPLLHASEARLERRGLPFPRNDHRPLTLVLDATNEQRRSGTHRQVLRLGLTYRGRGLTAGHGLEWRVGNTGERLGSRLDGSLRRGPWRLRGSLVQRWSPKAELETLELAIERRLAGGDARLRSGVRYDGRSERLAADLGLTYRLGAFDLSADLGLEHHSAAPTTWRAGLSVSYALTFDPLLRRPRLHSRSRAGATRGAAAARVFLDTDLDGRFDPDEQPLTGVTLRSDQGLPARTDEHGIAWLAGLTPARPTTLTPDLATLEDPYWQPTRGPIRLIPRAGRIATLDLPIVPTGEVDGTVYRSTPEGREPVGGVRLQLMDGAGRLVAETTSAYDGFYLFTQVLPGQYWLRFEPQQRERLGLKALGLGELVVGAEGTVISGVDVLLEIPDPRNAIRSTAAIR